jgi:hypothetical protein
MKRTPDDSRMNWENTSVFQIIYEAHPEGAVDEMIALTNDSIMSEMIDGADAEDDNRPGVDRSSVRKFSINFIKSISVRKCVRKFSINFIKSISVRTYLSIYVYLPWATVWLIKFLNYANARQFKLYNVWLIQRSVLHYWSQFSETFCTFC